MIDNGKDLKIALVGGGAIAENFYLPALSVRPGMIEKAVLVERDERRAEELAGKYPIGRIEHDYREALADVDGAIVAVPHALHFGISRDFLTRGVHVLCEKPLAETPSEVEELDRLANDNGVTISVNNTRRLYPAYQKVRELISQGTVGTVRSIDYVEGGIFDWPTASGFYFSSTTPKGILLDRGAHILDLIAWWLQGERFEVVRSLNDSFGGPEAVARVEIETSCANVVVRLSWLNKMENRYCVRGDRGTIEGDIYDWRRVRLKQFPAGKVTVFRDRSINEYKDFAGLIIDNFTHVIRDRQAPLVPGIQVRDSIAMINAAYEKRRGFDLQWYKGFPRSAAAGGTEKVLITGAGGFIGGWLAEAFHLAGGHEVLAGIRRWASAARIGRFGLRTIPCDVLNGRQVEDAVSQADMVVHCAVGPRDVTVRGTANIMEAALKLGIRRVVHISTTSVYGDITGTVDETAPFRYTGNPYGDSKIEAEEACWEYHAAGLPVTVIRPTIVYGPFSKTWTLRFAERLKSGKWGTFEPYGEGTANLVYIEDLIRAVRCALENADAIGEAFNISGAEAITWNEYFVRFNRRMGMPDLPQLNGRRMRLKASLSEPVRETAKYMLATFGKTIMKAYVKYDLAKALMKDAERTLKITPTVAELELYSRKANYSIDKATELLGYRPKYSVDEGLETSVKWLIHHGIVNP